MYLFVAGTAEPDDFEVFGVVRMVHLRLFGAANLAGQAERVLVGWVRAIKFNTAFLADSNHCIDMVPHTCP